MEILVLAFGIAAAITTILLLSGPLIFKKGVSRAYRNLTNAFIATTLIFSSLLPPYEKIGDLNPVVSNLIRVTPIVVLYFILVRVTPVVVLYFILIRKKKQEKKLR